MPRLVSFIVLFGIASSAAAAQARPTRTVWPDEGPRTWSPRATVPAITANDLRTRLYQLADDSMMGRRVGELGNYKATDYIAREFKRLGLKPAGDHGTYFQTLAFGPVRFDVASSRLSIAGASLGARSEWAPIAPTSTNAIGDRVDVENALTVFAGRWGDTSVALDPAQLRGKIAVFTATAAAAGLAARAPAPVQRCDSVPNKFGAYAAAAAEAVARADSIAGRGVANRTAGRGAIGVRDGRAQAAGAAAVLLVLPPDAAAQAGMHGAFGARMAMQPTASAPGTAGAAVVSSSAAAKLFGKPVDQVTVGTVGQPVSAHWTYDWHVSETPGRNVIAVLPGSDPARSAEYVLLGAHNDHVGTNPTAVDHDSLRAVNYVTRKQGGNDPVCRPTSAQQHEIDSLIMRARGIRKPRRDSIMNGADDDGSGTVVLLEVAEKFASEKPARSIIFVSHTGEEAGLLGSKWFVDHPTVPLTSITAALNMDMVGKGRVDEVRFGGPSSIQSLGSRRLSREFGDIIDSVNATRAEPMAIDHSWEISANPLNRFCRSDQVNYVNHDVPVTYFSLGYALDYHQPTDEPQYIDYDHAARVGRFMHDIMWAIAQRKDRPAISGADPAYPACRR